MTFTQANELFDFVQDHIDHARSKLGRELTVIASVTRAIIRLEQIRAELAQKGFTDET